MGYSADYGGDYGRITVTGTHRGSRIRITVTVHLSPPRSRPSRLAAEARLERGEIVAPALVVLAAELVEIVPGIDAGVVQIVEDDAHGVIADRLDGDDADMGAPGDQRLLAGAVALHLGRRAFDAQIFRRQAKPRAVVERDLEQLLRLLQAQLDRPARFASLTAAAGALRRLLGSRAARASSTSMIGMPSRIG